MRMAHVPRRVHMRIVHARRACASCMCIVHVHRACAPCMCTVQVGQLLAKLDGATGTGTGASVEGATRTHGVSVASAEAEAEAAVAGREAALQGLGDGAWADYEYNERPYEGRGWCRFESGVSMEVTNRARFTADLAPVMERLPPKVRAPCCAFGPRRVCADAAACGVCWSCGIERAVCVWGAVVRP